MNPDDLPESEADFSAANDAGSLRGPDAVERERDDWREKYARALADQENARKRHLRDLADARQYAITGFATDLLDAVDNMERALAGAGEDRKDDPVVRGVSLVSELLLKALKKHGVEAVEALGRPFDPNFHNAIAEDETSDAAPGTVTAELQRGYRIGDRLLRPAMVRVAKARSGESRSSRRDDSSRN